MYEVSLIVLLIAVLAIGRSRAAAWAALIALAFILMIGHEGITARLALSAHCASQSGEPMTMKVACIPTKTK